MALISLIYKHQTQAQPTAAAAAAASRSSSKQEQQQQQQAAAAAASRSRSSSSSKQEQEQQQQQQQQTGAAVMLPSFSKKTLHNIMNRPEGAIAMVVLFIMFQYIFNMEFVCPCDPRYNLLFCGLYVVLPFGIVTLIMIMIDPRCMCKSKLYKCNLLIFRSVFAGLVWVITAFTDGGVVVCILASNMTAGRQDACVEVTRQSPEQQRKINHYVNLSRISVLCVIMVISFPFALYNCCTKKPDNENTILNEISLGDLIRVVPPHGTDDSQIERGRTQNPELKPLVPPHSLQTQPAADNAEIAAEVLKTDK